MADKPDNGLKATLAAMERVKLAAKEAALASLVKVARDVAASQRQLAPKDTGALADSITVTLPGQASPAYSTPGGSRVAGEGEVLITAGNTGVRYAHIVEHGTSERAATPFFFVSYRLFRERLKSAPASAFRRAANKAWKRR